MSLLTHVIVVYTKICYILLKIITNIIIIFPILFIKIVRTNLWKEEIPAKHNNNEKLNKNDIIANIIIIFPILFVKMVRTNWKKKKTPAQT